MSQLLDQMRDRIRTLHYSIRTEDSYVLWAKQFILFHRKRHPLEMGEAEVGEFLTYLAVERNVAASTQNQALDAILFLYKVVLDRPLERVEDVLRAKKPHRLPVVFTREEVRAVLARMQGDKAVMASLLYGSGLRLMECLRLRVKDVDFGQNHIVVRDGKGQFDVSASLLLPLHQVGKLQRQFGVSRDNSVSERQFGVRETIRCQRDNSVSVHHYCFPCIKSVSWIQRQFGVSRDNSVSVLQFRRKPPGRRRGQGRRKTRCGLKLVVS